ncbi:MAG: AMP-binding protein, partial [Bacteroidota bacterium]
MNIASILSDYSEFPEPAIIHRGRSIRFAELDDLAGRIARLLSLQGVRPQDPVLVFQPMSIELYAVLLAIFRLGAIAMFLDPSAGKEHLERCCRISPPKAFIATAKAHLLRLLSPSIRRIPLQGTPEGLVKKARGLEPLPMFPCSLDDPALLT